MAAQREPGPTDGELVDLIDQERRQLAAQERRQQHWLAERLRDERQPAAART